MVTTTARRFATALDLLATTLSRFLKSYLVVPRSPQDHLVMQRAIDGKRARRRVFGAGEH
ncbi:hypothetical protein JQ607_36765 [Bradyrhizobium liaoningense]|uniref:hypothetical protein n=1 Tax=Bradyrhizobium liaoningense TaxID=43992 RepID=UPI001BAB3ABA|nr:hypothetical protein [Bradyrhizobium liaoningense]MBR0845775.1 hypothetical protein [Bradyrhizobium liaoningense]MBR0859925.1 hypothetical protein [Bradyrhizobium liaoningense]